MDLPELLTPERISCNVRIQSKKRALQTLAELLGASVRESLGMQETAVNGGDEVSDPAKFKAQTLANEAKSKEEKAKKAKSKKNGQTGKVEPPACRKIVGASGKIFKPHSLANCSLMRDLEAPVSGSELTLCLPDGVDSHKYRGGVGEAVPEQYSI